MIDLFIIVLLVWAAYSGWRAGFLKELISTAGFLVGLLVAAGSYNAFSSFFAVEGTESNQILSIGAFFIMWIVLPIVLGHLSNYLMSKIWTVRLGFSSAAVGTAISCVKYLLLISCVLNAMQSLRILDEERTASSLLFQPVISAVQVLFPADSTQLVSPADAPVPASDTVWIDMTGKKKQ